jgi:hypothetical protein
MILTTDNYPVFEADQVLHQKHLNTLISYFEEQDRVAHIHLLGMGIACGLELERINPTTIRIHCGSALTSLGYLIPFQTTTYTHFKTTTIADNFLNPDLEKQPYLESLYEYTQRYLSFQETIELLQTDATDDGKEPLTADVLEDKVVMLLLETALINEKNCVTIDCADKGKRLQFKVRPLLIDENLLEDSDFQLHSCATSYFKKLSLPRYNVPRTTLKTGDQVLAAFNTQIGGTIEQVVAAINAIHGHYQGALGTLPSYDTLQTIGAKVVTLRNQHRGKMTIQYVWDWLQDLAMTYNEIAAFHACNYNVCCPEKELFPFHVLLGNTEVDTNALNLNSVLHRYRTPFIKTGLLSKEELHKKEQLKGLVEKLIHQVNEFNPANTTVTGVVPSIKITPSLNGNTVLSKRSIPFYYNGIAELNKKWAPKLTLRNQQTEILSYHADKYNATDNHVRTPLRYSTEPYDFFRIEGHIGHTYDAALTDLIAQQEQQRLPFEVMALNAADFEGKTIDISNQTAVWDDMELDYDMAKEKVYNITEYVIAWIKGNKTKIQEAYSAMNDQAINSLEEILVESRELLVDDLKDFLPNYEAFYEVFEQLNNLFLLHRFCISILPEVSEQIIIEDMVDHFDEINMLFLEDPFTIIHEEANRRWELYFKETFLSKFLEKHQAISHGCGVPKGGTFVMVYVDNSVFQPRTFYLNTEFLLARINNYMSVFSFTEAQKKEILATNVVKKRKELKKQDVPPPVPDECKDVKANVEREVLDAAKRNMLGLPKATQDFLTGRITDAFASRIPNIIVNPADEPTTTIPEKRIIADFYLPYLCCSDGANINIVLPPSEVEPIVADFNNNDFNGNDFFTNDSE